MKRDLFIDFLKGLCIICVILTHSLPVSIMKGMVYIAWGEMAVPLFLLLQAYHFFNSNIIRKKKGLPPKRCKEFYCISSLWSRILKPFLIITLITGGVLICLGHNPLEILKTVIKYGGIGPGSYYVWVYIQFFLLLPVCLTLINKWGSYSIILFILVSQSIEWLCIYVDFPEFEYRLTCFRYVFLIYLGFLWVSNRISRKLTWYQIILAFISLVILLALYYTSGSLNPFLHDTVWRSYHWICYFYPAFLLPWLIWKMYDKLSLKIRKNIGEIGKYSYEIFLNQMIIFTFYPHSRLDTGNPYATHCIFIMLSLFLSIVPIFIWKKIKDNYLNKISFG